MMMIEHTHVTPLPCRHEANSLRAPAKSTAQQSHTGKKSHNDALSLSLSLSLSHSHRHRSHLSPFFEGFFFFLIIFHSGLLPLNVCV